MEKLPGHYLHAPGARVRSLLGRGVHPGTEHSFIHINIIYSEVTIYLFVTFSRLNSFTNFKDRLRLLISKASVMGNHLTKPQSKVVGQTRIA